MIYLGILIGVAMVISIPVAVGIFNEIRERWEWYVSKKYGYYEAINKFCEWMNEHWRDYADTDKDGMILFGGWQEDFKKAMWWNEK